MKEAEEALEENDAAALSKLEALLGYRFRDRQLLVRALTHRSFVNEVGGGLDHNESLEFLGDSVLGFIVSSRVFQRHPGLSEGELSKIKAYLVSAVSLLQIAERIRLGEFIRLSRGEEKTGGRAKKAILVDTYEAIIAAVYLDGGIEVAGSFVERSFAEALEELDVRELTYGDYKSALQEKLHDLSQPSPTYRVIDEAGPDHRKIFSVEVVVRGEILAEASGQTKKQAQQEAARLALELLKE